ncbi:hypothetical protein FNF29_04386 [Cafeteria roenbergensis]|uniref:Fibronectin type-III domain-containing protein n=2 Tax=Cafeteria roenbergensis TaxID=33653 RepID=A0A5A8CG88_CAFRO|nr:hypothetical protein FNF29_04386 [Cafeteria roenbergensis]|eukprot:KAA0151699.1 hypothetical protein FNF29_04386 [Cafeteria roenbergensis]
MAGAAGPVGRLLKAADKGDEDTLKRLLQSGTDANAWDAAGWTALMKASLSGHKRIVNLLLTADRPAQPMTANKLGKTALHYACMGGHHAIAQVLLMYGADPFAKDSEQSTPLDDAAANGHDHIIAQMQMRLPEIRLPSVPDPPRLQLSTVDMLEVRWDPPADDEPDGPRRVEAYGLQLARIEGGRMPSGEAAWRTVGRRVASRHCRIRGLRPGHAFVTRVAASNKFGWGRWSEASEVMWTLTAEEAAAAGGSSAQDGGSSAPSAGSNGARAARGAGSSSSSSSSASLLSSAPKAAPAAAAASPAENSTDAEVAAEPPSSGLFWGRSQRSMRPSTSAGQHSASEVGAGDVGEDSGHSWSGAGAADAGSVESGRRAVDTGGRQTGWTRGGGPGDVRQRARAEAARTASGAGAGAGAGAGTASPRDDIRTPLLEREFASTLQSLREALREANEERRLAETKAASLELQLRKSGRRADAADDRLKVYRADRRALRSLDMDVLTALETELERAIAGVRAEKNDRVRKVLAGQDDVD